jgi:tetratricopeptide (TPR) repeat protein
MNQCWDAAAQRLAHLASQAHIARNTKAVQKICQVMLALPLSKKMRAVAYYYLASCALRTGETERAREIFDYVAENASPQFRARAILSVAGIHYAQKDFESAESLCVQAINAAVDSDFMLLVMAHQCAAVNRSDSGDPKRAAVELEALFPLVTTIGLHYSSVHYEYLNNLGLHLGRAGRVAEGLRFINIAVNTRYAAIYPEWVESKNELQELLESTPVLIALEIGSDDRRMSPPTSSVQEVPQSRMASTELQPDHILTALSSRLTSSRFYQTQSRSLDSVITLSLHRGDGTPGLPMLLRLRHTIEPRAR